MPNLEDMYVPDITPHYTSSVLISSASSGAADSSRGDSGSTSTESHLPIFLPRTSSTNDRDDYGDSESPVSGKRRDMRVRAALAALTGGRSSSPSSSSSTSSVRRAQHAAPKRLGSTGPRVPAAGAPAAPPSTYTVLQKQAREVNSENADLEVERDTLLREQETLKAQVQALRAIIIQVLGVDPDRVVPDCA